MTTYIEHDFTAITSGTLATNDADTGGSWGGAPGAFSDATGGVALNGTSGNRHAVITTDGVEDVRCTLEWTAARGSNDPQTNGLSLRGTGTASNNSLTLRVINNGDIRLMDASSTVEDLDLALGTAPAIGDTIRMVVDCEGADITIVSIQLNGGTVEDAGWSFATLTGATATNHAPGDGTADYFGIHDNHQDATGDDPYAYILVESLPVTAATPTAVTATATAAAVVARVDHLYNKAATAASTATANNATVLIGAVPEAVTAASTAAAANPAIDTTATATTATATGAGLDAVINETSTATTATATAAALDATITTVIEAPAVTAAATGAGVDAATSTTSTPSTATATGAGVDAAVSATVTVTTATATATAAAAASAITKTATATTATATAAALDATITVTSEPVTATVTTAGLGVSGLMTVNAETATVTASAGNVTATTSAATSDVLGLFAQMIGA